MKGGHQPVPTLLTTGTGSGKTECFLYPILDYCYHQNRFEHRTGVKVIIMYPMNALASDQAKRLAETIWNDERLKGKVTAGLFVGEGVDAKEYPRDMGPEHIIENRDAILDTVPDILLTNFKMLDYGLMRQHFMSLWKGNIDSEDKKDGITSIHLTCSDQYSREEFSREPRLEALFKNLIEHKNSWETLAGSVGTIVQSGVIEDSELELKFISGPEDNSENQKWNFEKVPDIDSYKYVLNIKDVEQNTDVIYHIHPQFALGNPYGVRHYTVPDFQFICVSACIEGKIIPDNIHLTSMVYLS